MTIGRFKFVVWNPEPDETVDYFTKLQTFFLKYEQSYYIAAQEICPNPAPGHSGRHIDGYYEYPTQRQLATELKKFNKAFGPGFGDLQVARGTAGENFDYSTKEDRRFIENGEPGQGQGTRTDLNHERSRIMNGDVTVDQLTVENPMAYHQYGRTLNKLEDIALRKRFRTEMTTCTWYTGPTHAGKSHQVFEGFNPETHYVWKKDMGWQDGYTGQATIIINELDKTTIPYDELKLLIDKWPHYLRRRNREPAPMLATNVLISSIFHPKEVYPYLDTRDSIDQLLRRVKIVKLASRSESSITSDHFEAGTGFVGNVGFFETAE